MKHLPLRKERQKEMSSPLYPYRKLLRNANVRVWTNNLSWVSGALFALGYILVVNTVKGSLLNVLAYALIYCALFLIGCIGFLWFYRKEMIDNRYKYTGTWARFNAIFLMTAAWGLLLFLLFYAGWQ